MFVPKNIFATVSDVSAHGAKSDGLLSFCHLQKILATTDLGPLRASLLLGRMKLSDLVQRINSFHAAGPAPGRENL
jgi:hypothetical protein